MSRPIVISLLVLVAFIECDAFVNDTLSVSLRADKRLCRPVRKCLANLGKGESCETIPVPRRARLKRVTSGYRLTNVREGVWVFEDASHMAIILYKGSRLAVLDFPESTNDKGRPFITDGVTEILGGIRPRRIDMVYSHAHFDHIGGATKFYNWAKKKYASANFFKWGTFETRRVIKASKTKRAPLPNVIIRKRGRTLSVADDLVVKMSMVGGHTMQDLALHIPPCAGEPGILMLIDIVFPRWAPFFNLAVTDNVRRAIQVQKEILKKMEFKFFVGGHLGIGTRGDVRESYKYYKDLIAGAEKGIEVDDEVIANSDFVKILDPSAPEFGNVWFGTGVFRDLQSATCKRIMIKKWGCRIGGVDVVIDSHCFAAVTHVLVEV